MGLIVPADVDPDSGYRYYAPGQLERARLVARLRLVGMPLAKIRRVADLPPAGAAAAAAWLSGKVEASRPVVVVSGGNVTAQTAAAILARP